METFLVVFFVLRLINPSPRPTFRPIPSNPSYVINKYASKQNCCRSCIVTNANQEAAPSFTWLFPTTWLHSAHLADHEETADRWYRVSFHTGQTSFYRATTHGYATAWRPHSCSSTVKMQWMSMRWARSWRILVDSLYLKT